MSGATPYRTLDLVELFALELPPLEYAVEGVLPLGSLTMLAAREKAGKSLLAVDLCCSIALGEPFVGRAVLEGSALLVPAEENIREVRQRIETRLAGRRDALLRVLPADGFIEENLLRLDEPGSMLRLRATILEVEPVVVVLDPMRELHGLSENEADEMGPLMRPLRQLAHETNTAIVLNHHMNKGGGTRGSTAIRAGVDQEWSFERTDDGKDQEAAGATGTITVVGRFGPRQVIGIKLGAGLRWEPAIPMLDMGRGRNARDRVMAALHHAVGGLDIDALVAVTGDQKKTVQNAVTHLLNETPSPIVADGSGARNDPRRFRAADQHLPVADEKPFPCDGVPSTDVLPRLRSLGRRTQASLGESVPSDFPTGKETTGPGKEPSPTTGNGSRLPGP